jgi:hypothetical protein
MSRFRPRYSRLQSGDFGEFLKPALTAKRCTEQALSAGGTPEPFLHHGTLTPRKPKYPVLFDTDTACTISAVPKVILLLLSG